jgi:hypothetical protein
VAEGKPAGQRLDADERAALQQLLLRHDVQMEAFAALESRDVEHAFAQDQGKAIPPLEVRLLSCCSLAACFSNKTVEQVVVLANMLSLSETHTETRAAKSVRTQSKIGFFFEEAEDVQLKSPEERTDLEQAFSGDEELSPQAEPPGEQARCHVLSFWSHIPLFWPFAHLAFLKPALLFALPARRLIPPACGLVLPPRCLILSPPFNISRRSPAPARRSAPVSA